MAGASAAVGRLRVLPPRLLLVVVVLVPVVPLQGLLADHGGQAHRGVDRGEHGDLAQRRRRRRRNHRRS
eukprot:scaffold129445_cov60-Phaeocystis_antarctica.AAC.4